MNTHLRNARFFANLMDNQFSFLGFRFGLENIIGLVPGIGDSITFALSLYLIWIGFQMKLPAHQRAQMIFNVVFDAVIGAFPILGDLGDMFFQANMRNLRILEAHAEPDVIEGEVLA